MNDPHILKINIHQSQLLFSLLNYFHPPYFFHSTNFMGGIRMSLLNFHNNSILTFPSPHHHHYHNLRNHLNGYHIRLHIHLTFNLIGFSNPH